MDGLSGAASVIAVIQIAQTIASALKDYYEDVRDARADIQKIYHSIRSLESILSDIHDLINRRGGEHFLDLALFTKPSGPLRQSEFELHRLLLELKISPTKKHGLGRAMQSLTWPFKKKDVEKAVNMIDRHKSSLILEIGVQNLNAISNIHDIFADIRSEIRTARDESNRRRIVAWLSKGVPNPSTEHNLARERHEATTGSWLIKGDEFNTWISSENSFLWLNGGAGAGKSILCSTVIDRIQKHCSNEPSTAVVYWYFTFTDTDKQKVPNFLCSIIADICSNRRNTPQALQEAYDQANYGQQQPGMTSIMAMLKAVVIGFENIYLILDALDECPKFTGERTKLLETLHEIYGWKINSLHILATSRREVDIEESIKSLKCDLGCFASVGILGNHVEQDIVKYIRHRLEHREFQKWKSDLKKDVQTKLTSQANGMSTEQAYQNRFRLVALQLDALGRLRTESKIRAAMEQLPRTLDDFYDRILLEIAEQDQEHAHIAMQWLAFAARPISLKELAEAVIIQCEDEPYMQAEDRFLDYKDILEILPAGLVSTVLTADELDPESNRVISSIDEEGSGDDEEGSNEEDVWDEEHGSDEEESEAVDEQDQMLEQSEDFPEGDKELKDRGKANNMPKILIVQFAHFSVKEYLVSDRPRLKYQIDELSAYQFIAESCFAYLIYTGIENPTITTQLYADFPMLHYAATYWAHHVHILQSQDLGERCLKLALSFLQYDSYAWQVWAAVGLDERTIFHSPERLTSYERQILAEQGLLHPVSCVSGLGLSCLLLHLLVKSVALNEISQIFIIGNPLHIAARNGQLQTVQMLLTAGWDPNCMGGHYGNALQAASALGHTEVVHILLQAGADVTAQVGQYGNALQAASASGYVEVVRILLQAGADVNTQGGYYTDALHAASTWGHTEVVRILLQAGADVNAQGGHRGSALQAAAGRGMKKTARLLLQNGADVNAYGGYYGSPLEAALCSKCGSMVRLLLDHGAELPSDD